MKKTALVILAVLASLQAGWPAIQGSSSVEGYWLGTLRISGIELRVAFNIKANPEGTLTAALDSIDQGARDIPTSSVVFADGKLTVEIAAVQGRYEGLLDAERKTINGTFTQAGTAFPLNLARQDKPLEIRRPQEPKKPYPYDEREVSYSNPAAGITLGGALTLPPHSGPHPAVILISGSGAQDRDETVFNHKPFLILADHLTRLGVAVLRVDDRGVGKSGGDHAQSTTEDYATDVEAGIAYLQSRPDIDAERIGLIGHSEGGIIAPLVASRNAATAFIVLIAGTGLPGEDILLLQSDLISRASGVDEDIIGQNLEVNKKIFALIKAEPDPSAAEKKIRDFMEELYLNLSEERKKEIENKETWIQSLVANVNNPWFRYFLTYDPRPALEKVRCPVLAVIGEKDLQVPADINLQAIGEALQKGGNSRFRIEKLSGLNHLLQTATTGAPSEYGSIEETMSPAALDLIGRWILEITKK
ncbi:MAG: alpha/beta fold hydrolase [Candidatus Aminicenantes bacterium]|nr:alpha/beta fold hydrolase [Candidatus Aminicenantes bacterium]